MVFTVFLLMILIVVIFVSIELTDENLETRLAVSVPAFLIFWFLSARLLITMEGSVQITLRKTGLRGGISFFWSGCLILFYSILTEPPWGRGVFLFLFGLFVHFRGYDFLY